MRTMLTVAFLVAAASVAGAQERLADQLKKAVVQEEADRNPQKAIESYQRILADFQEERKVAATALFRMAECYRKAGKSDQAIQAYQRVVRDFLDQPALVESSRRQLVSTYHVSTAVPATAGTGRGIGPAPGDAQPAQLQAATAKAEEVRRQMESERAATPGLTRTDQTRIQTLESQMALLEQQIKAHERRIALGQEPREDPELFKLRQQLITLRGQIQEIRDSAADRRAEEVEATRQQIAGTRAEITTVQAKIQDYEKKIAVGAAAPTDPEFVALREQLSVLYLKMRALELSLKR